MHARFAAALLLLAAGCTFPLRATTRDRLEPSETAMILQTTAEGAAPRVADAFAARGFPLVDRRVAADGTLLLKLKGRRSVASFVSGGGTQHGSWVRGKSGEIGSVFYASLAPVPEGVRLELYGKPTYQGDESCRPEDPPPFRCRELGSPEEVHVPTSGPFGSLVTGREEAETVRGILVELAMSGLGVAPEPARDERLAPPRIVPASFEQEWTSPPPGWGRGTASRDATVRTAPDRGAPEVSRVVAGEKVVAADAETRGFRRVHASGGRRGYVEAPAISAGSP
jgi:hypothetical protein